MEAGVEVPEPLTGPARLRAHPARPRRLRVVVAAAFNGAFKTEHGHYGMMVHKRVLLPPVPGAATVVVLDDGRVGLRHVGCGSQGRRPMASTTTSIVSFRQNLEAVDRPRAVQPDRPEPLGGSLSPVKARRPSARASA